MKAIILSKDRPAQLHLALEALSRNGNYAFGVVDIIYTASTPDFEKGYQAVQKYFNYDNWISRGAASFYKINWVEQTNFKANVLNSLGEDSHPLVAFFTDDDILYDRMHSDDSHFNHLFATFDNLACFSLRLGLNTVVQDPYNNIQTTPPTSGFKSHDDMVFWEWREVPSYMNFGYPLSVDGHIFRRKDLLRIHSDVEFNNPNQQECAIQLHLPSLQPVMGCYRHSVIVNTPLNRVQETCMNRAGETFGCSAEDMNQRYLNGEKIDLYSIDFTQIVGCHQELEIKWTTK